MESISISKFKATCLEVLSRVHQTGQTVVVTKRGRPIAHLVPPPSGGNWLGKMRGQGKILGDLIGPLDVDWEVLES